MRAAAPALAACLALALPGLAGAAPGPGAPPHGAPHPAPAPPAAARAISIDDTAMRPADLVVAPGTRITWTNTGVRRHTSTSRARLWDSPPLGTGQSFSITAPAAPGAYPYVCRFHAYMRGTVTVSSVDLHPPEAVSVGRRAAIRGTVPDVPAGTVVRIEVRRPGVWEAVSEVATDAEGAFAAATPPLERSTAVRAVVGESVSPSRRVAVRPRVALRLRGARLLVRVRPARPGGAVVLEHLELDTYRWHRHARARLRAGAAALPLHAPGVYRVLVPASGGLADVRSGVVEFRPSHFRIG